MELADAKDTVLANEKDISGMYPSHIDLFALLTMPFKEGTLDIIQSPNASKSFLIRRAAREAKEEKHSCISDIAN